MAKTSPSARTLAECKRYGWIAQNVEQTIRIPGGRTFKRDLFGCIDIVAMTGMGILGIQSCVGASHAARRDKILAEPRMRQWLQAGGFLEVWSWAKQGARGKAKRWTLRVETITLDMFALKEFEDACSRCALYGSAEQHKAVAERLAAQDTQIDALRSALTEALDEWPQWVPPEYPEVVARIAELRLLL